MLLTLPERAFEGILFSAVRSALRFLHGQDPEQTSAFFCIDTRTNARDDPEAFEFFKSE